MSEFLKVIGWLLILAAIIGATSLGLGSDYSAAGGAAMAWWLAITAMAPVVGVGIGCLAYGIMLGDLRAIRTGIEWQNAIEREKQRKIDEKMGR